MNTLDLLYRIYRARYSLDVLQRRLDAPVKVVFLGEHSDTERMLQWLGELHPQAQDIPIEQREWPVEPEDWEKVSAWIDGLGLEGEARRKLRPTREEARAAFAQLLENVKSENCSVQSGFLEALLGTPR